MLKEIGNEDLNFELIEDKVYAYKKAFVDVDIIRNI